jgi:acyl-CoA hydrolase
MTAKSSMEIGVRIESENLLTGEVKHTASAYLTFVALDKAGRPTQIPSLVFETAEEKQRNSQAQTRRKNRLAAREQEKK